MNSQQQLKPIEFFCGVLKSHHPNEASQMLIGNVHCLQDRSHSQFYYRLNWDIQKKFDTNLSNPKVQDFMQNAIVPDNISLDINGILHHTYGICIQQK